MNRVVITGLGAVTPLGNTFAHSWHALSNGTSGICMSGQFDIAGLPWKATGEIRGFQTDNFLNSKEQMRLDPFVHYAVAAALMAAEDSKLIHCSSPFSAAASLAEGGVIIGSSRGGIKTLEKAVRNQQPADTRKRSRHCSPYLMPATTVSMAASYTAQKLGINAYCLGISNACTSGTNAVGEAYRLISSGFMGPIFAGGADAPLCRTCMEGYGTAGALSSICDHTASRPFDKNRDGFVLSEGACVVVLEELHTAMERGATIYAEIVGYGNTVDAFHQTRPLPEGEARALLKALSGAGIGPEEVDFISCHGTSTPAGDLAEALAIQRAFGEKARTIPASSAKSMTGHMLAASGAFETACTATAIRQGRIFPTINLTEQDNEILLSVVREPVDAEIRHAVVNSFGFGGVNAVLVLKKSQG